jgi:hypothetical protein
MMRKVISRHPITTSVNPTDHTPGKPTTARKFSVKESAA